MKNAGKIFEDDFKKSIPSHCFVHRLKDPPQSFGGGNDLRFSWKNPCDYYIFDSFNRVFHCIELKSTKGKSISFENEDSKSSKMIHRHQILKLMEFNSFNNVNCGFIFNFRQESEQTTYYQDIEKFREMILSLDKKSFNVADLNKFGAIELPGKKLRTHYKWNLDNVLKLDDTSLKSELGINIPVCEF